jgi:hypothetical protein
MSNKLPGQHGSSDIPITISADTRSNDERRAAERALWKKAQIWKRPQGFDMVPDGRAVSLTYRDGDRLIDFPAELAGGAHLDIIVFDDGPKAWIDVRSFESEPVSADEAARIRADLIAWLKGRGVRFTIGGQDPG